MRTSLIALAVVGASAATAFAASPGSGTISTAEPSIEWGGSVTSAGSYYNAWAEEPSMPCPSKAQCDAFDLTLAEAGTTDIKASSTTGAQGGGYGGVGIRVTKPDGSVAYSTSDEASPDDPLVLTLENAEKGDYTVEVVDSFVCCGESDYTASATLRTAPAPAAEQPAPPAAPPAEQPAPQPQPQPQSQPQPAEAQPSQQAGPTDFTLTAKAR